MADNKHDDEDLMSDFRDLFDEQDPAKAEPPADASKGSADLDELDAYLDDFSGDLEGLDVEEPSDTLSGVAQAGLLQDEDLAAEHIAQIAAQDDAELTEDDPLSEPITEDDELFADALMRPQLDEDEDASRTAELDAQELDLSVGLADRGDSDTEADTPEMDEDDVAPSQNDMAAATLAAAAAGSAYAASATAGHVPHVTAGGAQRSRASQGNSRVPLLALALSVLGGVTAVLALALSLGQRAAMDDTALPGSNMLSESLAIERMRMDIATLATRVNELAIIIEGPMSHLRQSSEDGLEAIEQRLASLEASQQAGSVAAPANGPKPAVSSSGTARLVSGPSGDIATPTPITVPIATEASRSGGWSINLISLSSEKDARTEMARLRQMGIRVEMQEAQRDGRTWYRLQVPGFDSREGARAYIATIQQQTGINNAWVTRD